MSSISFHSQGYVIRLLFLITRSLSLLVVQTVEHRLVRKTQLQQCLLLPDMKSLLFIGELHPFCSEFPKFTSQTHRICPGCPVSGDPRGGLGLVCLGNTHCCSQLPSFQGILSYTGSVVSPETALLAQSG